MVLRLLIDAVHADETRVVIADNSRIHDFDFVTAAKKQVKGNIYLAKITRVEPSLQAAFVEYGGGKQGFLPFAEIHPDYYQIPMADRKRLLEEAEEDTDDNDQHPVATTNAETASETEVSIAAVSDEQSATEHAALPFLQESIPLPETETTSSPFAEEEPAAIAQTHETPVTYSEPASELLNETPAEPAVVTQAAHDMAAETSGVQSEATEPHEIETLVSDEDAVRQARPVFRRYKIQEVIKRNQIVLVQVIKEERGNKGVSLTTFISLAGRYCVLMPNSPKGGGISRKIMSGEDRKRLKEISAELKTARGMSAIIRTAGIDRTRAEIKRDYEYLVKLWETIREQTLSSTAPALIYEEGDLIKRTIRDLYSSDIEEVIIEGESGYNQAKDFLKMILASHAPRVKLYEGNIPLFYSYNIEDQLASMYDPVVKLRSGGYIVLNPTEALISIDVNSGRSTGERNIEETATKTNLEAAAEIARQLRLRDLAGLIVIDFIDMMDSRNRRAVERALKDALKLDRAKIQLGRISPFGLLEMSRQRLRPSLSETSTMPCPHCQGRGIIRSDASVAIQIIRAMEKEAAGGLASEIKLTVTPSVALHLLNARRDAISSIEQKYGIRVITLIDTSAAQGVFRLDKVKGTATRRNAPANTHEPVSMEQTLMDELPMEEEVSAPEQDMVTVGAEESAPAFSPEERPFRRNRRGGRGRRNGNGRNFNDRNNNTNTQATDGPVITEPGAPEGTEVRPPREDRGGRGRRPRHWRDRRNHNGDNTNSQSQDAANNSYSSSDAPRRPSDAPRMVPITTTNAQVPPLAEQASPDAKTKKGWWRRMVE